MGLEYLTNVPLEQARADYLKLLKEQALGQEPK